MDNHPKLMIVRGLPGSGKTTIAKSLNVFHIEADMYHVCDGTYSYVRAEAQAAHDWCLTLTMLTMIVRADIVVANTFVDMDEMTPYINLARAFGYRVEIIHATGNYGSDHDIPGVVLESMRARWQTITQEHLPPNVYIMNCADGEKPCS